MTLSVALAFGGASVGQAAQEFGSAQQEGAVVGRTEVAQPMKMGGGGGGFKPGGGGGFKPVVGFKPPTLGVKPGTPIGMKPPTPVGFKPLPVGLKPLPIGVKPPTPIGIKPLPIGVKPPTPIGFKPPMPIGVKPPTPIGFKPPMPIGVKPPTPIGFKPPIGVVVKPPKPCPPIVLPPHWNYPPVVYFPVPQPVACPAPVAEDVLAYQLSCRLPGGTAAQALLGVDALISSTDGENYTVQGTVYGADNQNYPVNEAAVGEIDQMMNLSLTNGDQLYLEPLTDASYAGYLQGTVDLLGLRDQNGLLCTLTQQQ